MEVLRVEFPRGIFFFVYQRVQSGYSPGFLQGNEANKGAEMKVVRKARGNWVPQGGTAKFMSCRLRVYTVLAFYFSCGEVRIRFRTPAFAQRTNTI
jgi:hypothetical protein